MTVQGTPPATRPNLPVWQTVTGSYGFVFSNFDRFFALAWAPIVIAVAFSVTRALADSRPTFVLLELAYYAVYVVFAVRWHRFFLLDDRHGVFTGIVTGRNFRFLGYSLLLALSPVLPLLFFGYAIWPAVIVLYFVFLRFSLVLPSVAIDRPLSLEEAWGRLGGNTWRFIGALILIVIPIGFVTLMLMLMFGSIWGGASRGSIGILVVGNVVTNVINLFGTAIGITVLSKTYGQVVGAWAGNRQ